MTFDDVIRDTFPTQTKLDAFTREAFAASRDDDLHPSVRAELQVARHQLVSYANDPRNHEGE